MNRYGNQLLSLAIVQHGLRRVSFINPKSTRTRGENFSSALKQVKCNFKVGVTGRRNVGLIHTARLHGWALKVTWRKIWESCRHFALCSLEKVTLSAGRVTYAFSWPQFFNASNFISDPPNLMFANVPPGFGPKKAAAKHDDVCPKCGSPSIVFDWAAGDEVCDGRIFHHITFLISRLWGYRKLPCDWSRGWMAWL